MPIFYFPAETRWTHTHTHTDTHTLKFCRSFAISSSKDLKGLTWFVVPLYVFENYALEEEKKEKEKEEEEEKEEEKKEEEEEDKNMKRVCKEEIEVKD